MQFIYFFNYVFVSVDMTVKVLKDKLLTIITFDIFRIIVFIVTDQNTICSMKQTILIMMKAHNFTKY